MPCWLGIMVTFLSALVFGALGALTVAFVECLSEKDKNPFQYLRRSGFESSESESSTSDSSESESSASESSQSKSSKSGALSEYVKARWKPLLGGFCAAVLAGGSAAEFAFPSFGEGAEHHPVLTSVLTGALLAVIVVLVIEALVRSLSAMSWREPLESAWDFALRRGRRGADDLRKHLRRADAPRVDEDTVSKMKDAKAAYELARELSVDLSARVGQASLFAFASDQSELGRWMLELSAAADTLQRTLERYSKSELSHQEEERSPKDIAREWRDYIWWLLVVHDQGLELKLDPPRHKPVSVDLLRRELDGHRPSNAPPNLSPERQ